MALAKVTPNNRRLIFSRLHACPHNNYFWILTCAEMQYSLCWLKNKWICFFSFFVVRRSISGQGPFGLDISAQRAPRLPDVHFVHKVWFVIHQIDLAHKYGKRVTQLFVFHLRYQSQGSIGNDITPGSQFLLAAWHWHRWHLHAWHWHVPSLGASLVSVEYSFTSWNKERSLFFCKNIYSSAKNIK